MKKRLLLVDDDPAVRRMLFRLLTDEDYSVSLACTGREAIKLASTADLVLLDLNLAVEDECETFERITADRPSLPVILITARPTQLAARAPRAGALMDKPLDLPKLLRTIRELLEESTEHRLARLDGN